jgi:hypothetical protein
MKNTAGKNMKYYIHYSYTSFELDNTEEQGVIECRNLIHAVMTYICTYHGISSEIRIVDLQMTIERY